MKVAIIYFAKIDAPTLAVVDVSAEMPPLDGEAWRQLSAKLCTSRELSVCERAYLRELIPGSPRGVGRPPQQDEQRLEMARCYIWLEAADPKRRKIDARVAALFDCKPRTVQSALSFARGFNNGAWWAAAEQTARQDQRLEVWR
jgi:hypothetical protein